jgi:ABC-type nickel/cobalt efflux system permease component RcnA
MKELLEVAGIFVLAVVGTYIGWTSVAEHSEEKNHNQNNNNRHNHHRQYPHDHRKHHFRRQN